MKTITAAIGLAVVLALPAGVLAKPNPDRADKRAAKAECKTLRGKTDATREAFRTLHRGFAACVRDTAADEARQEEVAHKNAAKECAAERQADREAFEEQYGTNVNNRNAFGKCVSKKAREKEATADEEDRKEAVAFKNAAKECAAEREADPEEFATTYGTNANRSNAFGKCVSKRAREA